MKNPISPAVNLSHSLIYVIVLAVTIGNSGNAASGEPPVAAPPAPSAIMQPRCLEELACLSWPQLECLYRQSPAGKMPCGFVRGKAFLPPGTCLRQMRSNAVNALWKGKHFCPAENLVINQWFAGRAIRGELCCGPSWLDGKPSIIIDYRRTSSLWSDSRDELREVAPGLYVGMMFQERRGCPRMRNYVILEICCRP